MVEVVCNVGARIKIDKGIREISSSVTLGITTLWEHLEELVRLWPQFAVTFLGVFLAFGLDRTIDWWKNRGAKNDLLRDLHDELETTKNKIPPQTKDVLMLYPEVWDSTISSGQIRLLNSEQVKKLTVLYREIKGTQYEAEWVRRAVEEFNNVPENEKSRRDWLKNRYKLLWRRQTARGGGLTEKIEAILQEKWWP